MILSFSDIMPDRVIRTFIGGEGLLAFIRRVICLEADSIVKSEMRESFGETWKNG